jgi:hypothetical protein
MTFVKCNDSQYGDSRIRMLFKESRQRDLRRVKSGITDVLGEIDVHALRQFQNNLLSSSGPFMLRLDEFEIEFEFGREVLPAGETE